MKLLPSLSLRVLTFCILGLLLPYALNTASAQGRSSSTTGRSTPAAGGSAGGQETPDNGTTRPANPGSIAGDSHVLSPGDVVELSVFNDDRLNDEQMVSRAGTVTFKLIEPVKVAGKTLKAAEKQITELYDKDYLVNPQIKLRLRAAAEHFVTVSGAVAKPGSVAIPQEGTFDVLAAIAGAGGATEKADLRTVILRSAEGRSIQCDVAAMQENPRLIRMVQKGDTILVQTKVDRFVTVSGEVNKPGRIPMPDGERFDVLTAIAVAGDFNKFANPRKITVVRGTRQTFELDGAAMARGDAAQFELQPEDKVRVVRRKI